MRKLTIELLQEFDKEFHESPPTIPFYGKLRYGQALCNCFELPKSIEDGLYYNESELECQAIIWNYVCAKEE